MRLMYEGKLRLFPDGRSALSSLLLIAAANGAAFAQAAPTAGLTDGAAELHWYRGNTHAHTLNNGGDSLPIDVARWYRDHDYQFLVITDHDYATDVAPINAVIGAHDKFLILPGEEVTQSIFDPAKEKSFDAETGAPLHVNALFSSSLVLPIGDRKCNVSNESCFYVAPSSIPAREVYKRDLQTITARGGIGQINHPNFFWTVTAEDLVEVPDHTLIEIWNFGTNPLGGDDGEGHHSPSAESLWDGMLTRGKIIWGVGSDDSHIFRTDAASHVPWRPEGNAWITVRAAHLTPDDLKTAIINGNFYASNGVELFDIRFDTKTLKIAIQAPPPEAPGRFIFTRYSTQFIGKNGEVLATVAGTTPSYECKGGEGYIRAVVTDSKGYRAWTQPVFQDARRSQSPYMR